MTRQSSAAMGPLDESLTRRGLLRAGSMGLVGLGLPQLLQGEAQARQKPLGDLPGFGRARSCILIWLKGGPSHLDTFDPKPDAPAEIRGEFNTLATSVPGITFSDRVPRLAGVVDKLTVVRSLTHRDNGHPSAAYEMTTGHPYPRAMNLADNSTREDHPHIGAAVAALADKLSPAPPFALVPDYLVVNGQFRSGQNAGFLGKRFDPLVPGGDPSKAEFRGVDLGLGETVDRAACTSVSRCSRRSTTGCRVRRPTARWRKWTRIASRPFRCSIPTASAAQFDVQAEPDSIRERYGRNFFGQSVLMGRRLLEAGVRLVHVNCMSSIYGGDKNWDTHKDNFKLLADVLLPRTDQGIAALVEDLSASGLLDETLVVVTGEFGRTPKINKGAGRDHWPQCFSVLLAGAGLPGGRIHGSSDKHGAAPASDPVTSSELSATILHALGLDPETQLATQAGRPWQISDARPVTRLWS